MMYVLQLKKMSPDIDTTTEL